MRRTKPKKLADAAGGLESAKKHRTPAAYINLPIMSMQKRRNRKTTCLQYSPLKQ